MKRRKLRLEHVTWLDSSGQGRWVDINIAKQSGVEECESVGWVLAEDKKQLTIVGELDNPPGYTSNVGNRTTIPKVNIRRRYRLNSPKDTYVMEKDET